MSKEKKRGTLTDEITNMTGIFKAYKDCQRPRTVLIEGEEGKTTYCQKLAYDWATKRDQWDPSFPDIEVLLLLRCHDIKTDIWEAIDDQILLDDVDEEVKQAVFKFIRENQSKVLLVLDGLDEADARNFDLYFKLLQRKVLPNCHIVLTSRHEAGRRVRRYCDILWEIVGFTREDAKSFILKYFKGMEHLSEKLLEKLWGDSKHRQDLIELTKSPLNTALLCVLCEDFEGVFPSNKTRLYVEIVDIVLTRYETKNGLSSKRKDLLAVYKEELLQLGSLALQSLKEGKLYIDEHISDALSKFGFLSIQTGGSKRNRCLRYWFLHKTFQEFFAGFYLSRQILNGEIDCNSVVTDERYWNELRGVFLFMSGIIFSHSEETAVSLVDGVATHINLTEFDDAPLYLRFAFDCILECETHLENLRFNLVDIVGRSLKFEAIDVSYILQAHHLDLLSQVLKVNTCSTDLNLTDTEVSAAGAASLSEALKVNTCLTSLNLAENEIGSSGAASLSEALKVNTCLTSLNLAENEIGSSGAASLSEALKVNTSLTNLHLGVNKIGAPGAASLFEALKVNTCLTNLDLAVNEIGASGAASLSEALKVNTCLTNLNLAANEIGPSGAASLSQALKVNTSLTELHLGVNEIGAPGAASLSEALKVNTCLTWLGLCKNQIGDSGAASLSEALKVNTCLTELRLIENQIGDSGAAFFSEALKVNTCLTELSLIENQIGDSGAASLSEALKVNTSLIYLYLPGNQIGAFTAASLPLALKLYYPDENDDEDDDEDDDNDDDKDDDNDDDEDDDNDDDEDDDNDDDDDDDEDDDNDDDDDDDDE